MVGILPNKIKNVKKKELDIYEINWYDTRVMVKNLFDCSSVGDREKASLEAVASKLPDSTFEVIRMIASKMIYGRGKVISSQTVAHGSALTIPDGASSAVVTAVGDAILFRVDGTAPTSGNAHYAEENTNFLVGENELDNFKFIQASSGGSVFVTYYG